MNPGDCMSGCVVRGKHESSCSGKDDQGRECWGCVPRSAEHGVLCRWCRQQLQGLVVDIPGLIEHLAAEAAVVLQSPMGKTAGGGRHQAGSRMLYPASLEAADELVALLGTWVDQVVADHPGMLIGPSSIGWRYSDHVVRWSPYARDWVVESPRRLGATQGAVDSMVKWLLPHMPWVAEQEWAAEMLAELRPMISTIKARWPMEESRHQVPMPCPQCGAWSLVYNPPVQEFAPIVVACTSEECARQWIGEDWAKVLKAALMSKPKERAS